MKRTTISGHTVRRGLTEESSTEEALTEEGSTEEREASMKESVENEISMKRYLLGQLTEKEQQQLEEQLMTSNECFEQLLVAEDELVDEFLHGTLSAGEQQRFNNYFLCTPDRRQKLRFSRSLQRYLLANAERPRAVWTGPWFLALRSPYPVMGWGLAGALLLLVIGGGWSVFKISHLQKQLVSARAQQTNPQVQVQDLRQQLTQLRERNDQLASDLRRQQNQRTTLEQELAALKTSSSQNSSSSMIAFALIPGMVRDLEGMKKIVIPTGTAWVQLQLDPEGDDYTRYQAVLQKAEGDDIWNQSSPKVKMKGNNEMVVLTLPAKLLSRGDYILKLSGMTTSGNLEDASKYYFRVLEK